MLNPNQQQEKRVKVSRVPLPGLFTMHILSYVFSGLGYPPISVRSAPAQLHCNLPFLLQEVCSASSGVHQGSHRHCQRNLLLGRYLTAGVQQRELHLILCNAAFIMGLHESNKANVEGGGGGGSSCEHGDVIPLESTQLQATWTRFCMCAHADAHAHLAHRHACNWKPLPRRQPGAAALDLPQTSCGQHVVEVEVAQLPDGPRCSKRKHGVRQTTAAVRSSAASSHNPPSDASCSVQAGGGRSSNNA